MYAISIVPDCVKANLWFPSLADSIAPEELTQPPSLSVSLGERAELTCLGEKLSEYYVYWYQQKPNHAPQLIIYKDTERPAHIPDRFSGASSGTTATLTITGVQEEDEADYYCQSRFGDNSPSHCEASKGGSETKTRHAPRTLIFLPFLSFNKLSPYLWFCPG